jgi:hypothetical protein
MSSSTPLVLAPCRPITDLLGRPVPSDFESYNLVQSMARLSDVPDFILNLQNGQLQFSTDDNIDAIVESMFGDSLQTRPQINYPPQVNGQVVITNQQAVRDALMFGNPGDAYQYVSQPTNEQVQAYAGQLFNRVNHFNNDISRARMRLNNIQSPAGHVEVLRNLHRGHGTGVPSHGRGQAAGMAFNSRISGHGLNRDSSNSGNIPNVLGRRPNEKTLRRTVLVNKRRVEVWHNSLNSQREMY